MTHVSGSRKDCNLSPIAEIERCIVRQAYSTGYRLGSPELQAFLEAKVERLGLERGRGRDGIDRRVAALESGLIRFQRLVDFAKSCKRNAGLTPFHLSRVLGVCLINVEENGQFCEREMVTDFDPVKRYLTGHDRLTTDAPHPSHMSDGCWGTSGFGMKVLS